MLKRDLERQSQNGCNKTPTDILSGVGNDEDMYFCGDESTLIQIPNELLEDTLGVLAELVALVRSYLNQIEKNKGEGELQ